MASHRMLRPLPNATRTTHASKIDGRISVAERRGIQNHLDTHSSHSKPLTILSFIGGDGMRQCRQRKNTLLIARHMGMCCSNCFNFV